MDFGATGGSSFVGGLAVRRASKDSVVWCFDIKDFCNDCSGTGTKMASSIGILRIKCIDGTMPTAVQIRGDAC